MLGRALFWLRQEAKQGQPNAPGTGTVWKQSTGLCHWTWEKINGGGKIFVSREWDSMFEIRRLQAPAEDLILVTSQPPPSLVQIQAHAWSLYVGAGPSPPAESKWVRRDPRRKQGKLRLRNSFLPQGGNSSLLGTELALTTPLSLHQGVSACRSQALQRLHAITMRKQPEVLPFFQTPWPQNISDVLQQAGNINPIWEIQPQRTWYKHCFKFLYLGQQ